MTESARTAEYVRWEVLRIATANGVREDEEALQEALAEGWEPFSAAHGTQGHWWYLRRRIDGCDWEHPHPDHPCGKRIVEP